MAQETEKSTVECTGKHLLMEVKHKGTTYECMVNFDCKDLFKCDPRPDNWVGIENVIRDAACNQQIKNLNELG